jgi:DNA replicative helicase MCM subunit Mcm2 (Cdc46/Mcm family)
LAPDFLEGIRADAIAIRSDKKIIVEVVHETAQESGKLERLRRLLKEQPGWELRVILVSPATAPKSLPVQSVEAITKSIHEAQRLTDNGFLGPGLLVGWASLEAAARRLLTSQFSKPQTPGRLVDVLAEAGNLTPSEADRLRELVKLRNAFIHGDLSAVVTKEDVQQMISILKTVNEQIKADGVTA